MVKESLKLELQNGLEARPAALFVQIASKFESHISVIVNEKQVNAKSIMGMMSLSVGSGDEVVVVAEGADEEAAASEIELYLQAQ